MQNCCLFWSLSKQNVGTRMWKYWTSSMLYILQKDPLHKSPLYVLPQYWKSLSSCLGFYHHFQSLLITHDWNTPTDVTEVSTIVLQFKITHIFCLRYFTFCFLSLKAWLVKFKIIEWLLHWIVYLACVPL